MSLYQTSIKIDANENPLFKVSTMRSEMINEQFSIKSASETNYLAFYNNHVVTQKKQKKNL